MIGAVILAAGASRRLGEPKQFLRFGGETLVRRAVRTAHEAGCSPVVVVAGLEQERIAAELVGLTVHLVAHPGWSQGIGSSLRAGVHHTLEGFPHVEALMIMVCDQPFVTSELLTELIVTQANTRARAVACKYADTVGVPALFDRSLFSYFDELPDEQGAKSILAAVSHDVACVDFPQGMVDIDTPADRRVYLET